VFSFEEFVREVSLERISTSGPIFDLTKLEWLNGHYIRQLSLAELAERVRPFLERAGVRADDPPLDAALPLVHERLKRLAEAPELLGFLYRDAGELDPALLVPKGLDARTASELLEASARLVREAPEFEHAALEARFRELASAQGVKTGQAFMALRVACTYSTVSPPLFETMEVLGRERVLARLEAARARLATARPA
jgi:glutamyl-tRNA synthetase